MKKRIYWILAALLYLGGCAQDEPVATTQPPEGLYDATHPTESQQGGALKAFSLGDYDYQTLLPMGEDYLLFGEDSLTLLSGETMVPVKTVSVPDLPMPDSGRIQVTDKGVGYFSSRNQTVSFLSSSLTEVGTLHLTTVIGDGACLSPECDRLYYCTDNSILALDLYTGASRTIKQLTSPGLDIVGLELGGTVLHCTDGKNDWLISVENGQTLAQGQSLSTFTTAGDRYYLQLCFDTFREYVFGQGDTARSLFFTEEETVILLPENHALVRLNPAGTDVTLEYFDLATGRRSAVITLEGEVAPEGICGDGKYLWLRWEDTLYRWDPALSPTGDDGLYTAPHYTRENPNEAGLQLLRKRLDALEETYGVEILWREEAASVVPWEGYSFETEFVTPVYDRGITQLEQAMANFPADFFQKATAWSGSPLQIVLVRGIYGNQEQGTLTSAPCIQYQLEGKSYLALSLEEGLEQAFYHGTSHVMETHILSTCTAYYEWNTQNPAGFRYDNDYIANQNRQDTQYLQPEDRYFIDLYSMSFAIEDRARILEYACMPGNEGYFTSKTMAEKLRRVCNGIREAFGLAEGSYLWEQYLGGNP